MPVCYLFFYDCLLLYKYRVTIGVYIMGKKILFSPTGGHDSVSDAMLHDGSMLHIKYFDEIVERIRNMTDGYVFTASDFLDIASSGTVNKVLSRLCKDGQIRRILQGVYDVPVYIDLIEEYRVPLIDKVAEALARKYNWTIVPEGNTALNILHLSTQVPNVWLYASDGPNHIYNIGNWQLRFKKEASRDITGKSEITRLVIQAIKKLGKESFTQKYVDKLSSVLSSDEKAIILKESTSCTVWVREIIVKVCSFNEDD